MISVALLKTCLSSISPTMMLLKGRPTILLNLVPTTVSHILLKNLTLQSISSSIRATGFCAVISERSPNVLWVWISWSIEGVSTSSGETDLDGTCALVPVPTLHLRNALGSPNIFFGSVTLPYRFQVVIFSRGLASEFTVMNPISSNLESWFSRNAALIGLNSLRHSNIFSKLSTLVLPYTGLIPRWLEYSLVQIYGPEIYDALIYQLRPFAPENQVYLYMFLKKTSELVLRSGILLPQLINLFHHRTSSGLSPIFGYTITLIINIIQFFIGIREQNVLKYTEYAIQALQTLLVVAIMLTFSRYRRWTPLVAALVQYLLYWCKDAPIFYLQKLVSVFSAAGVVNLLVLLTGKRKESVSSVGGLFGSLLQNVTPNWYFFVGFAFIVIGLVKTATTKVQRGPR
ncbi:hypothetical protein OGAPHI_001464 [Ogataea philodendri]|uniref:Uncharacterized protein n=1 Tax=Ogataea philodendri TaxID=1378263 RepID=A0A9P8PBS3_9ASCO|nr:uncharacterized protein OGAPHI_001464 [Ogataea philodendri]KAH3669343.1 hypothetical protein OGAPHI_001464 [Ogataea philodendri]